jgi:hypothetical protein
MVDARIPYLLIIKISNLFQFKKKLYVISKVALVVCVWLMYKVDVDLDDDLCWIQASLTPKVLQRPNFGLCCFGHVAVIRRCDMIFWKFYGK